MAVWRIWSLHLSRTEARCLVGSMTHGVVWDQVYNMLRQLALPESPAFTTYTGDDTTIHGAACYLPDRIGHLYKCPQTPPSDIMQPGDPRLHWLPIAVDGTSRHEASYVHCTLGGTTNPNQLSSWWQSGGSKNWETLYVASQEIDFDVELRKAATVSFKDMEGNDRQSPPFFSVCRWESTGAHGGLPQLEGRIPWCQRVLGLHVQPCCLPCYLWQNKCNRRQLGRDYCHRCCIEDHYE